jgi:ribosomal protein S25
MVMGKENPSAKYGKQNGSQMNKSQTTTIDFDEIDSLFIQTAIPAGAITAKMLAERYGICPSTARKRLFDLQKVGYVIRKAKAGQQVFNYAIKESA